MVGVVFLLDNPTLLSLISLSESSIFPSVLVFLASIVGPTAFFNFFFFLVARLSDPSNLERLARPIVCMECRPCLQRFYCLLESLQRQGKCQFKSARHICGMRSTCFAPQIGNKDGDMIQVIPRGDLRLPFSGSTEWNDGRNHFQRRRGGILGKGTLMHWLNVSGVATSFSIGSMWCLCQDIAIRQGYL
jgi:hypothetical protein